MQNLHNVSIAEPHVPCRWFHQNNTNCHYASIYISKQRSVWLLGRGPWPKRLMIFVFAGFAWTLWTCRNKMMIEKQFPKAPTDVIYTALSFMLKWSYLLKEGDRERITQMKEDVLKWLKEFKTSAYSISDVVEI